MNKNNKSGKNRARDIGFYALILVILLATIFSMTNTSSATEEYSYADVVDLFQQEQVESFYTEGSTIVLTLKDGTTVMCEIYSISIFINDLNDLVMEQKAAGIISDYDYDPEWTAPWWASFLPYLIIMVIMIVVWVVIFNRTQGGGAGGVARFSKARTKLGSDEKNKKTFADVAGADEEKEELQEIVDFLKEPKKYTEVGARVPKGVLLIGPPGTGKTLLAKAVAGEAGVQFLSISGSDFVELYVGVGAGRVRDLFEQAKKAAPAIIFIDEIDAVGRQRGSGLGGGHDEREQTLNQLLVEMDGFGNNDGVIVIAATNRADILDNALLRPGRFDRQVYVGLPDIRGREAILKIHARGKPLGDDVDLNSIAKGTPGFSGADLENLMNESALLAVRRGRRFITMEDVEEAILKVSMGPEKKSKKMSDKARRLTAYHESGHAIAGKYLQHTDPVHYITIIPRGQAGGFTMFRPQEDLENFKSRSEMFESIVMALGGRVAEDMFLDDISTGASGDIQQATHTARAMVTQYGMSEKLGPISYDSSNQEVFIGRYLGQNKTYSEEVAAVIDAEVKRIFAEAEALCRKILDEHREQLIAVAEYLLENESMEGEDFNYFCDHGTMPTSKKRESTIPDSTIERPARRIARFDDDTAQLPEPNADEAAPSEEPKDSSPENPPEEK
ncbi:MAG: ATP-dependent zinc metalloprotease FtsH [Oscillospiraceae bacterium]|nr:ATP-dependent zinc metalloprotease FtsH [Oscillospiraceae bacterium]